MEVASLPSHAAANAAVVPKYRAHVPNLCRILRSLLQVCMTRPHA